jgi:hypothetical protein
MSGSTSVDALVVGNEHIGAQGNGLAQAQIMHGLHASGATERIGGSTKRWIDTARR